MNNRIIFKIAILLFILFLIGCNNKKKKSKEGIDELKNAKEVSIFAVKEQELVPEIRTFGEISFKSKVELHPKTSGRVEKINIDEGDRVNAGEILAVLEQFELIQQQKQAIAELDAEKSSLQLEEAKLKDGVRGIERQFLTIEKAKAELDDKKQSADNLKNSLENKKKLLDAGAIAAESIKNLETNYYSTYTQYIISERDLKIQEIGYRDEDISSAGFKIPNSEEEKIIIFKKINTLILEKEVEVAKSRVKIAETKLDSINALIKETYIRSPINGIVASRQIEIGEEAKQDKALFVIIDTKDVYAKINISESDLARVKPKGDVILSVDALGKKELNGKIKLISPIIDTKTRTIQLSVVLSNPQNNLIPGMFVRAIVKGDEKRKAIFIPSSSLLSMDKDNGYVYLIKKDIIFKKDLKLGAEDGEMIEVISGLKDNDIIVINPSIDLVEGSKIVPKKGEFENEGLKNAELKNEKN